MVKNIIISLCFLLLSSCVSAPKQMINLPHSKYSWQIQSDSDVPSTERVSQAVILFYRQWQAKFGDRKGKVKKNLYELMIEWSSEEKVFEGVGRDNKGRVVKKGVVNGMTVGPTYVWLRTNPYKRVFASSLVHELVHVALWADGCRGGDPDHEGGMYVCWTPEHTNFIDHLNKLLFKFDI